MILNILNRKSNFIKSFNYWPKKYEIFHEITHLK